MGNKVNLGEGGDYNIRNSQESAPHCGAAEQVLPAAKIPSYPPVQLSAKRSFHLNSCGNRLGGNSWTACPCSDHCHWRHLGSRYGKSHGPDCRKHFRYLCSEEIGIRKGRRTRLFPCGTPKIKNTPTRRIQKNRRICSKYARFRTNRL